MIALSLASASAAYAQETTGAIRGSVEGAQAGVAVTIEHVPSGTRVTAVTNDNGNFIARGLRVGGPYRITAGGKEAEISSIGVGDPAEVILGVSATAVEELVVSASRVTNEFGLGSGTNIGADQIANLPSISRDIKDVARMDPFALINDPSNDDAFSFAGVNTRLNQLTVDGIRQNDEFGLNNNGYPTQRSPISLDAVESVSVSASPFSVINNGFIGGSINAVTRSGGNQFKGSAFYELSNDSLLGDSYEGFDNRTRVNGVNNPTYGLIGEVPYRRIFEETIYGASLGGPIIKDKLFFFLSYEKFESEFSLEEGPADGGFSTDIPRITADRHRRLPHRDPGPLRLRHRFVRRPGPARPGREVSGQDRLEHQRGPPPGPDLPGDRRATASTATPAQVFVGGNSVTQPRDRPGERPVLQGRTPHHLQRPAQLQLDRQLLHRVPLRLQGNRNRTDSVRRPHRRSGHGQRRPLSCRRNAHDRALPRRSGLPGIVEPAARRRSSSARTTSGTTTTSIPKTPTSS